MKSISTCRFIPVALLLGGLPACQPGVKPAPVPREDPSADAPIVVPDAGVQYRDEEPPAPPPEGRAVVAYRDGRAEKMVEQQAADQGLTVVDMSNFWVPFIFSERDTPDGPRQVNSFRPIFRKLANDWPYESRTQAAARKIVEEQIRRARAARLRDLLDAGLSLEEAKEQLGIVDEKEEGDTDSAPKDAGTPAEELLPEGGPGEAEHYLEVYGIPPTLSVLKKRAQEEMERPCLATVDFEKIRRFDDFVAYKDNNVARRDSRKGRNFAGQMNRAVAKLGLEDPLDLIGHAKSPLSAGLVRIGIRWEALAETQKLLVCEGFFKPGQEALYYKGGLDWKTHQALVRFERKNRIFGWGFFGRDTLEALCRSPKERLFDAFRRVLAERLIDTAGIIEDGSSRGAGDAPTTYFDEYGQTQQVRNLVAEFTATAIKEMDLGTPDKVIAFLKRHADRELDQLHVALPLPKLPPYYSEAMELHVEIDRGDVWYDYPYTMEGKRLGQPRKRMPLLSLFVKWRQQDILLARMNTTIGGWRSELGSDGYEYFKYKNSDVGLRVWKEIVAGPVWMPPASTPVKDLLKTVHYRGRRLKVPNYDEFGPWYASAYGLVAAFHVRQVERSNGTVIYMDNGIRTHGSVDYNSILRRFSHGCHRLYNHLAIRLFDFVLRHRPFNRVGQISAGFGHRFTVDDQTYTISLNSKGYKYELIDPVPVQVTYGRIRGRQRSPIDHHMPKPNTEYGADAQFLPEGYARTAAADGGVEDGGPGPKSDGGPATPPAAPVEPATPRTQPPSETPAPAQP